MNDTYHEIAKKIAMASDDEKSLFTNKFIENLVREATDKFHPHFIGDDKEVAVRYHYVRYMQDNFCLFTFDTDEVNDEASSV